MIIPGEGKPLDAITLGRAGMDLYASADNVDFADVQSFRKSVGGSPANIAVGMSRLGAKVGIVTKLSEDSVGRFVETFLSREKVNTDGIHFDDSGTRTSLALTEMKPEDCSVVIYRNNAADLLLDKSDIDPGYIQSCRLLIVSGTALCSEPSRSAAMLAMSIARDAGVKIALDLDYRAYTWASLKEASEVYREAAAGAALLFGNTEEFSVLCSGTAVASSHEGSDEGATENIADNAADIASFCFEQGAEAVFLKGGGAGSQVFIRDEQNDNNAQPPNQSVVARPGTPIPYTSYSQGAYPVQTRKPFGAGDAYASAICTALCNGQPVEQALQQGAAAAAIVVAGDCCCESSPDTPELMAFIKQHT